MKLRLPWQRRESGIANFTMRHAAGMRGIRPRMVAA